MSRGQLSRGQLTRAVGCSSFVSNRVITNRHTPAQLQAFEHAARNVSHAEWHRGTPLSLSGKNVLCVLCVPLR